MESAGQNGGYDDPDQFGIAGKAPDAPVQTQSPEDGQAEHCVGGGKAQPTAQIISRDLREAAVKAKPEGEEIGQIDSHDIIECQDDGHSLPVAEAVGRGGIIPALTRNPFRVFLLKLIIFC